MKSARILAVLLFSAMSAMTAPAQEGVPPSRVITIAARRFEFMPSTITLKKGETVKLIVTSEDVTHGFFLRPLKIDADLAPGESQQFTVTPQSAGTFSAICHHFCGSGHGGMKLTVVVE